MAEDQEVAEHGDSDASWGYLKELAAGTLLVLKMAASASIAETHRRILLSNSTEQATEAGLSESGTSAPMLPSEVETQLESILGRVRHEIIEDGRTNAISDLFPALVAHHFRSVLPAVAALIDSNRQSNAVIAELLKEIGRIRNASSHADRRWLLEHALTSSNPAARDGASVGLAWLSDVEVLPSLRKAMEHEPLPQLRRDFQQVIQLLSQPGDDAAPEKDQQA